MGLQSGTADGQRERLPGLVRKSTAEDAENAEFEIIKSKSIIDNSLVVLRELGELSGKISALLLTSSLA